MLLDKRTTRISAAFVPPKGWREGQAADISLNACPLLFGAVGAFVYLELFHAKAAKTKTCFLSMNIYGLQIFQHTFACVIRL